MAIGFSTSGCIFDASTRAGARGNDTADASELDAPSAVDANTVVADATPLVHYRQELSFTYSPVSEDLVDFPVLVILDSTRIGYGRVQDEGQDLRFTDASNNKLPHEIEKWNEQGRSYLWVQVPKLSVDGNDSIWMSYGSPAADDGQNAAAVWNNGFNAVWHLGETSTDVVALASHLDSTAGAHHMDHVGGVSMEDGTSLGQAQSFDGVNDYLEVASTDLQNVGSDITISARARPGAEPNFYPHVLGAGADGRYWQIFWDSGNGWVNRYRVEGFQYQNWTNTGSLGNWSSLASVSDGDRVRLYVDGIQVDSNSLFFTDDFLDPVTTPIYIGSNPVLNQREFQGEIDEVRISDVARSAEWIYAEHLCNTDALISFGTPETVPGSL